MDPCWLKFRMIILSSQWLKIKIISYIDSYKINISLSLFKYEYFYENFNISLWTIVYERTHEHAMIFYIGLGLPRDGLYCGPLYYNCESNASRSKPWELLCPKRNRVLHLIGRNEPPCAALVGYGLLLCIRLITGISSSTVYVWFFLDWV